MLTNYYELNHVRIFVDFWVCVCVWACTCMSVYVRKYICMLKWLNECKNTLLRWYNWRKKHNIQTRFISIIQTRFISINLLSTVRVFFFFLPNEYVLVGMCVYYRCVSMCVLPFSSLCDVYLCVCVCVGRTRVCIDLFRVCKWGFPGG